MLLGEIGGGGAGIPPACLIVTMMASRCHYAGEGADVAGAVLHTQRAAGGGPHDHPAARPRVLLHQPHHRPLLPRLLCGERRYGAVQQHLCVEEAVRVGRAAVAQGEARAICMWRGQGAVAHL